MQSNNDNFAARSDAQGEQAIVGWCVHTSSDLSKCAMYNVSEKADALDAAKRWGASMTAVCLHPNAPELAQWNTRKGERRGDNDEHEEQIAAAFAGREPVDRTGTDRRKPNAATVAETRRQESAQMRSPILDASSKEDVGRPTAPTPTVGDVNPLEVAVAAPDAETPESDAILKPLEGLDTRSVSANDWRKIIAFMKTAERQRDAAVRLQKATQEDFNTATRIIDDERKRAESAEARVRELEAQQKFRFVNDQFGKDVQRTPAATDAELIKKIIADLREKAEIGKSTITAQTSTLEFAVSSALSIAYIRIADEIENALSER